MRECEYFWTYQVEDLKGPLVDFAPTIGNDANDDFLPAVRAPRFRSVTTAEVSDILENSVIGISTDSVTEVGLATHEFIVRQNRTSSSLYIVITMKSSVCLPYR